MSASSEDGSIGKASGIGSHSANSSGTSLGSYDPQTPQESAASSKTSLGSVLPGSITGRLRTMIRDWRDSRNPKAKPDQALPEAKTNEAVQPLASTEPPVFERVGERLIVRFDKSKDLIPPDQGSKNRNDILEQRRDFPATEDAADQALSKLDKLQRQAEDFDVSGPKVAKSAKDVRKALAELNKSGGLNNRQYIVAIAETRRIEHTGRADDISVAHAEWQQANPEKVSASDRLANSYGPDRKPAGTPDRSRTAKGR